MKILILANNDVGLYNFRKELIQKLIELKNEVYISLPKGERVKDLIEIGCKFFETPVDRRGTNLVKDFKLLISRRPSGLRKTRNVLNSLAHRTTWLRSDFRF